MNKIIKKLKIPGHETKTIVKLRQNANCNEIQSIQLSLDVYENSKVK